MILNNRKEKKMVDKKKVIRSGGMSVFTNRINEGMVNNFWKPTVTVIDIGASCKSMINELASTPKEFGDAIIANTNTKIFMKPNMKPK